MLRFVTGGGSLVIALAAAFAAHVQAAAKGMMPRADDGRQLDVTTAHLAEIMNVAFVPRLDLGRSETWAPRVAFGDLPAVRFHNLRTREDEDVRLYDASGLVNESEAQKLDRLCADDRDPDNVEVVEIDRRTLQLIFRAAYHFQTQRVVIISGYRSPNVRREGMHGRGKAVDFQLVGTSPSVVARYLRQQPRAGVGYYPRTYFVHIDSRPQSFHWVDRSGPGRHGRETPLSLAGLAERDERYQPADDWPEGTRPFALDALSQL